MQQQQSPFMFSRYRWKYLGLGLGPLSEFGGSTWACVRNYHLAPPRSVHAKEVCKLVRQIINVRKVGEFEKQLMMLLLNYWLFNCFVGKHFCEKIEFVLFIL